MDTAVLPDGWQPVALDRGIWTTTKLLLVETFTHRSIRAAQPYGRLAVALFHNGLISVWH